MMKILSLIGINGIYWIYPVFKVLTSKINVKKIAN